ncbi:hypothetical protein AAFF_G00399280 [Aldrovandia affinis]|uniref:Uncharacterized protein n=1 Tax=Aldrovandia affinis TaxID=143900 RepID=A0AAD7SD19_9TELE|nr:hypothetical protein AAFF_G00399280 [Aldrovandia affinis]
MAGLGRGSTKCCRRKLSAVGLFSVALMSNARMRRTGLAQSAQRHSAPAVNVSEVQEFNKARGFAGLPTLQVRHEDEGCGRRMPRRKSASAALGGVRRSSGGALSVCPPAEAPAFIDTVKISPLDLGGEVGPTTPGSLLNQTGLIEGDAHSFSSV